MAEIVRRRPKLFADYIPIVALLIRSMAEEDLDHFRASVLGAVGRLGTLAADHLPTILPTVIAALDHSDSQVRGMAVWCLGQVGQGNLLTDRPDLLRDEGTVNLYEDGLLHRTTVCHLAERALSEKPADG